MQIKYVHYQIHVPGFLLAAHCLAKHIIDPAKMKHWNVEIGMRIAVARQNKLLGFRHSEAYLHREMGGGCRE